jgi:hypothetical protein
MLLDKMDPLINILRDVAREGIGKRAFLEDKARKIISLYEVTMPPPVMAKSTESPEMRVSE